MGANSVVDSELEVRGALGGGGGGRGTLKKNCQSEVLNRPFSSSPGPLFQNEGRYSASFLCK